MEIEQAEALDESSIQERMAALLEAEEANPEDEEQHQEDDQEEVTETEGEEGEEEDKPEPEEETLELRWNGETKAFKKSEVVELAQQGYDYTQKTQQLAEQRKTLEAREQQFQQQTFVQSQLADKAAEIKALDRSIADYKAINWQELAQTDPMQYLTLNQSFTQLKEARNEAIGEYNAQANQLTQAQHEQRQQFMAREAQLMADAIPEMRGEKAQQTKTELKSYLQNQGFNDSEIDGIMDHRMVKVAVAAMKFAKLQSAQPEVKKRMAEAPKQVKGKSPAPNNQVRELKDRARKGDERAIAALIERTL